MEPEKLFLWIIQEVLANWAGYVLAVGLGVIGSLMFGRHYKQRIAALEKKQTQTFNFNVAVNTGEKDVRAGIIRGSFHLGYMIVLGRQTQVLIPSAYFEQPDGSRVPLNFEGFDIPDGVEEAGSFGIEFVEPDPKKKPDAKNED